MSAHKQLPLLPKPHVPPKPKLLVPPKPRLLVPLRPSNSFDPHCVGTRISVIPQRVCGSGYDLHKKPECHTVKMNRCCLDDRVIDYRKGSPGALIIFIIT